MPAPPSPARIPAPRRRTALLAQRDDYARSIMITSLEAAGYPVIAVPDPLTIADQLARHAAEAGVVIVDMDSEAAEAQQPVIAGLRRPLDLGGGPPVVLLTRNTARFLDESVAPGFSVLRKPFPMGRLVELVDQLLGVRKDGVS